MVLFAKFKWSLKEFPSLSQMPGRPVRFIALAPPGAVLSEEILWKRHNYRSQNRKIRKWKAKLKKQMKD